MTRVKVCGLTRAEDVRLAAELGAWALGFVLAESPRRVTAAQAAELVAAAEAAATVTGGDDAGRGPHTVLVVTTQAPRRIAAALGTSGADAVQLSAGVDGPGVAEVLTAASDLGRRPLVIAAADTPDAGLADFTLLDTRTTDAYGGTGLTLDWAALAADPPVQRARLVLAGGLRPDNVVAAVRALRPAVVDVSGGVEAAPGRKDRAALREFFTAVEQADREAAAAAGAGPAAPATRRSAG